MLVIDDEPHIRRFLQISLKAQGYTVLMAETGQSGLDVARSCVVDIVLLDIGLPDMDGHAVLTQLKEFSQAPVIMLTARSGESSKVTALDGGARDYVTKPFGIDELMARIRVLLRSADRDPEAPFCFDDGCLRIDELTRVVMFEDRQLALSRKEYALLLLLARNAGRVVTHPAILTEIWGPSHSRDAHYIRILLSRLRPKIGDTATAPRYIKTLPGVGLQFQPAA
ncbi:MULTISPECIES: response regulator transcription factor [unclassified Stenotrophomonas]|uniref:response regulator transcription factor n=1 Tax=unclassified Stenotrophomonas TaxID=196198 RepID=UPI002D7F8C77|nr:MULTISPECIES: response regulator transcription factor [unclassified Stenotrophomonas]